MGTDSWIYIQPHIVGTADAFEEVYSTDREALPTRKAAEKHGWDVVGSDDFWTGQIQGGRLVALFSGPEKRADKVELQAVRDYLALDRQPEEATDGRR